MQFESNPEVPLPLPHFTWIHAFSPVIRLSAVDLYKRGGIAGSIDARLDALAWGSKDGRHLSAPAIQVDHLRNGFDGGRWVFVNSELPADFYRSGQGSDLIPTLDAWALEGSQEFTVRPVYPLYLPGEPVQLDLSWRSANTSVEPSSATSSSAPLTVKLVTYSEDEPSDRSETSLTVAASHLVVLPARETKGLHIVEAEWIEGTKVRALDRSGFWVHDTAYLRSGPRMTVNKDYFEMDGHPLAVVGTTYMSSEVQRLYFEYPNVYVWNRDLGQIHSAGLNMIRSSWWTGWDKFRDENGKPYERTLRTMEAFLMTARKNGLPVQFNFFAFLSEVLGGTNPYLDPEALRQQETLIAGVVARFSDVPYLAWDLIHEPSFSQHLWTMQEETI